MAHPIHPTADDVYSLVRAKNPTISLGTVYRNLNLLAENGILTKLTMPGGSDRFDGRLDEHYHMLCTHCGKVYDVELDIFRDFDRQIRAKTGFCVSRHQLLIEGICKECSKEK